MASWLVRPTSTSNRAVRFRALVGDIVLCSWARLFTLTVPLSTQVYKWVPANLMLRVTLRWTSIPSTGGVEILLVSSCYRNRDKIRSDGSLGSYVDITFFTLSHGFKKKCILFHRVMCGFKLVFVFFERYQRIFNF